MNATRKFGWIMAWFGLGIIPTILFQLGFAVAIPLIAVPGALGLITADAIFPK
jgi:hypothetical protein